MKRFNVKQATAFFRVIALVLPLLFCVNSFASASPEESAPAVHSAAPAVPGSEPTAAHAPEEEEKAGDVIMHHILNNNVFAFPPFGEV